MIPLIIAGVAAAASIAGGIAKGNAAESAERSLLERKREEEARSRHELNTNFLDTATAKSTLTALRKRDEKAMASLNNDTVKQGTSEEGKIAAAGKLQEGYVDAASRLAGYGTQRQDQLQENSRRRLDSLDNAIYNSHLSKADAYNGIISSIGSIANAGMEAYGSGAFAKKVKPGGSLSKSPGTDTYKVSELGNLDGFLPPTLRFDTQNQ